MVCAPTNSCFPNGRYKLLRHEGREEFYDLAADPYEHNNLLSGEVSAEQQAQYRLLREQIDALRTSTESGGRYLQ